LTDLCLNSITVPPTATFSVERWFLGTPFRITHNFPVCSFAKANKFLFARLSRQTRLAVRISANNRQHAKGVETRQSHLSAGVDGMTIQDATEDQKSHWLMIKEPLLDRFEFQVLPRQNKSYRPAAVRNRIVFSPYSRLKTFISLNSNIQKFNFLGMNCRTWGAKLA
jgi:hypothetical protein